MKDILDEESSSPLTSILLRFVIDHSGDNRGNVNTEISEDVDNVARISIGYYIILP